MIPSSGQFNGRIFSIAAVTITLSTKECPQAHKRGDGTSIHRSPGEGNRA
ncbi:MAG: hypothetical protein AAFX06_29955 [Planctomycetota bacterium]